MVCSVMCRSSCFKNDRLSRIYPAARHPACWKNADPSRCVPIRDTSGNSIPKPPKSSKVKVSKKLPGPSALYHCITLKVSSPPAVCNSITRTHPGIMLVLGFPAKKRDTKLSKVGAKPQETDPQGNWAQWCHGDDSDNATMDPSM